VNYNHYLSIFEAFNLLGEVFMWRHNLESSFPCYQSNGFYLSGFYLSVCNIASARFESSLAALGCPCLISQAEKWQMVAKWDIWGSKKNLFKTITLQKTEKYSLFCWIHVILKIFYTIDFLLNNFRLLSV